MTLAIEVAGLCKRFGLVTAVDHIDFSVSCGQIFGLLGPNAAGKTTTIRLLAGILVPDEGSVRVLGLDLGRQTSAIKQRIGYVSQHFALYPELTVEENLAFYSGLYRCTDKIHRQELLEVYGLTPWTNQLAGTLSGGYKRRLSIACAVSHQPDLVFLDEPTAGIDPVTRKEIWDLFYDLAAAGKTLFVTTHYMEEAERCNQLAFIDHGVVVAQDTPNGIKKSLTDTRVYACNTHFDPTLSRVLTDMEGVIVLNQFGDELRVIVHKQISGESLEKHIREKLNKHINIHEVSVNIEDAFITLTRPGSAE